MSRLGDITSKWQRLGGSWSPALWPIGGPEIGDPVLPDEDANPPEWVPYPAPRLALVGRAMVYVVTIGKEPADPQAIDCRGLEPASYTERRAALLIALRHRAEFADWSAAHLRRIADIAYGSPLGRVLLGLAKQGEDG